MHPVWRKTVWKGTGTEGKLSGSVLVKKPEWHRGRHARRLRMIACPAARRSRSSLPGRLQKPTAQPLAARRRIRATGAAEIEMTAPNAALGLLCCGRQRLSRARSALRAQACALKMGVKSWLFSIEQHVHSSLRSVLNHPGPVSESHHRLWMLSSQCCVGLAG